MRTIEAASEPGRIGGQGLCGVNHVVRTAIVVSRITNNKVEFELLNTD